MDGHATPIAVTSPDLPLVEYAAGDALVAAARQGFEVLGPLRVWIGGE
jgi:hypothetical protein